MTPSSSPLSLRHANSVPRTPSLRAPIYVEDDIDELAGDTIPCSPGAVLRHDDTTQPTQVLSGRPTLPECSSPASVIEVPASSPFQPATTKRPNLGSRLAPAGTNFCPPTRPMSNPPQPTTNKRPAPEIEPIDLISDDDHHHHQAPARGDIRPTAFKAHVASFAYDAEEADRERKTKEKLRQIYHVFKDRYPSELVRKSLSRTGDDVERAIDWLERHGSKELKQRAAAAKLAKPSPTSSRASSPSPPKEAQKPLKRRLIQGLRNPSKSALQVSANKPSPAARSRTASPSPPRPKQMQMGKQPRRRLVQGLRNPGTPSPQRPQPASSSDDPLIIDLADNEQDDDAYQAERSPTPDEDSDSRVLNCINTSTAKELAAMTGMKEAELDLIVEKRPFDDLAEARRVTYKKKPGSRKVARVSVGEGVVDAIEVFLNAAEAIDQVVEECEKKAKTVKDIMDTWEVDSFGYHKRSERSTPDLPPTPTSLTGSRFIKPPIPKQPTFMDGHCQMKPFQLFGLNWMSLLHTYDIGCILADEMGLGKTCQVISLVSHLVESFESEASENNERPWPNLIVVPPSTYNNWLAEFERFAPELSVIGYRGSQSERMEIAYEVEQAPEDFHVVLGTYSQINNDNDIEALNAMGLHAAIYDEGHKMKNPETKIYRDLRRLQTDWKMLLTGTPVQNNLLEMTSLLNFINPKMFEGYMEHIKYIFSQKVSIRDVSNGAFLYSERVKRARTILEPFILQRRKDQVLSDMPRKINNVLLCDMTEGQRPVYDEYESIFKLEPSQRVTRTAGRQNDQNNVWMQLRKAAIHPLLFRRHFTDAKVKEMGKLLMNNIPQSELHQPNLDHLIQELKDSSDFELHLWCRDYPRLLGSFDYPPEAELDSGKVKKLLELVDQYQENGDRVLVFSKFSRMIELLREVLALKDIDHRVLMGNTNVAERQTMIDEFNETDIPVFLLTTGAGGTGINLTSANKVIIFDQSDNPQDDIQAENRAHRLGQKRDVEVIRLISEGTLEELVNKACQKKIELANKVTGAAGEETVQEAEKNIEQEVRKMMEEQMTPP